MPHTSGDWEFARKLFVELKQETIVIPGDGALVDLVSDNEEAMEDDTDECEKEVVLGNEEEEGTMAVDGPPEQATTAPSPPPSA